MTKSDTTGSPEAILHRGIVESVDTVHKSVTVKISDSEGGCSECAAASMCGVASGRKENILTVPSDIAGAFAPGDRVRLVGSQVLQKRAIMLCTVIPCVALVVIMVGVYLLTLNQLLAVVCGLASTIAVYVILYLFRDKINKEFIFNIIKESDK